MALGAPKDAEATELAKKAIDEDYLATKFDDAVKHLKAGLALCEPKPACSPKVRAQLHIKLGTILLGSLKKPDEAKAEFQAGIKEDSSVGIDPDLVTPEVETAFAEAKKSAPGKAAPAPTPPPAPETPATTPDGDTPKTGDGDGEPAKPKQDLDCPPDFPGCNNTSADQATCEPGSPGCNKTKVRKNWVSLSVQQDMLIVPGVKNVCNGRSSAFSCTDKVGRVGIDNTVTAWPAGTSPNAHLGNELAGGFGLATTRILAGYDRVIGPMTLGARVGVALGGHPSDSVVDSAINNTTPSNPKPFLLFHGEARAAYWFGSNPFGRLGFRPYAVLGGGMAQVDAHLSVKVFPNASAQYFPNNPKTVTAWDVAGQAFISGGIGTMYAIESRHGPTLEFKFMELFPQQSPGFNLQLGYAFGF